MRSKCVILADAHQTMLEGMRGLLGTEFDSVVMVADENSLFKVIEEMNPDLAVVDLSLPVSGEVNIAMRIAKNRPSLRFILISIHDSMTCIEDIMAAGAAGFVLKRLVADDLMLAVDAVMEGNTYVSPLL